MFANSAIVVFAALWAKESDGPQILFIFPFWFWGLDLGSDYFSS